ncbi:MAG: phage major capsid protein [Dehalococcoidia bacterium]|nr:phage major capsid protein [Dehalococcoidia bacterium]
MSILLAESAKLSNDVLLQGVIETVIKDSPVLQAMPFIEIVGNGLTYNRETALAAATWYAPLGAWASTTAPTFDQLTATLAVLGRNADVDLFIKQTRSNIQDIEAAVLELAAKSVRQEFERAFIYGTTATYIGIAADANSINGLIKLIATGAASDQVIAAGATGATLTLAKLDELIDAVKGGKPDLLLMSKRSRRKINALARAAGSNLEVGTGKLGEFVQLYNGIPIGDSDYVLDIHVLTASVETAVTGGTCSTIYALQFGEGAVCGATNGGIQVEPIGQLEAADAMRHRIKWYCGLVDFCIQRRAALIGVQD